MFGVPLIKKISVNFQTYCHDSNAFRLSALQSFYVNKVSFLWASLATMFLVFQ